MRKQLICTLALCLIAIDMVFAAATAFPEPYGWDQLTNQTEFNPINASVTAWQSSTGGDLSRSPKKIGFGWILASAAIVFMMPAMIYIRTQKPIPASFGLLLITALMHYYDLLPDEVWKPAYIIVALGIAFPLAAYFYNK